jgi:hypothetical protein
MFYTFEMKYFNRKQYEYERKTYRSRLHSLRKPTEVCGRLQQETQVCSVVIQVSSQN